MRKISCFFLLFLLYNITLFGKKIQKPAIKTPIKTVVSQDSVISIIEVGKRSDTAKIKQVIAVKLKTTKRVSLFNSLFINGLSVPGIRNINVSECDKIVYFKLDENVQKMVFEYIQNQPSETNIVPVKLSVGITGETCATAPSYNFYLEIKREVDKIWILVIAVILIILLIVAFWKNVLKDDDNIYYSLGRTQLLYWTLIFIGSYLLIWYQTSTLPDITGTSLVILGISIGTTAAGKLIENKNATTTPINGKSEGWLMDILSDGSSINIHRFQSVIFNLVFGIIYIQKAFSTQTIPVFDDNVLLLMGMSSGTYAGLKITEAKPSSSSDQNITTSSTSVG